MCVQLRSPYVKCVCVYGGAVLPGNQKGQPPLLGFDFLSIRGHEKGSWEVLVVLVANVCLKVRKDVGVAHVLFIQGGEVFVLLPHGCGGQK